MNAETPEAIVGGHLCLDIIPQIQNGDLEFRPGALEEIGSAKVTTGGCVSNTGISLARLGTRVELVSRIGDDVLGNCLHECLRMQGINELALNRVHGESTSYSLIFNPPGRDRMVFHYPGTNNTFDSSDLLASFAKKPRLLHFGYPPLMRKIYALSGAELRYLLSAAQSLGMITSLDMAYPDPASDAGRADWRSILLNTLPFVDFFLPSYEEIVLMLGLDRSVFQLNGVADAVLLGQLQEITSSLIRMGASVIGIKLGERGLYLRSAAQPQLTTLSSKLRSSEWGSREMWTTVFQTNVAGTTGAGDATIAGFLFGVLNGFTPEEACSAACAVGACSVEAADATSGVVAWDAVRMRVQNGWRKKCSAFLAEQPERIPGVFAGPLDKAG